MSAPVNLWNDVKCVCFDVDSTVCADEGIDELARFLHCKDELQAITKRAMDGSLDFRQALSLRLELMKPTRTQIEEFVSLRKPCLTKGIDRIFEQLRLNGIEICLVSGGIDILVKQVAELLGVPTENVYSNKLLFSDNGSYAGFDTNAPTSTSDGKSKVVLELMQRFQTNVVIVGDGMTDARACPPAAHFIGFGANVNRESVRNLTPYFCSSVHELETLFRSVGLIC